jgi:hypothetical protein
VQRIVRSAAEIKELAIMRAERTLEQGTNNNKEERSDDTISPGPGPLVSIKLRASFH